MMTVKEEAKQRVKEFVQNHDKVTELAGQLCNDLEFCGVMDGIDPIYFNLKGEWSFETDEYEIQYKYDKDWVEEVKGSGNLLAAFIINGYLEELLQEMLQEDLEEQLLDLSNLD